MKKKEQTKRRNKIRMNKYEKKIIKDRMGLNI